MNNWQFFPRRLCTYIAVSSAFSIFSTVAANAATFKFEAILEGTQEVPPVLTSGSGFATGVLTGDFGSDNFVFTYTVDYFGLSSEIAPIGVTGGHLHNAPFGVNGPIRHILDNLDFNYTGTTNGTITGDWRFDDATNPLTEALAQELISGNFYINLHTENFPSGEIRGQLNTVPEPRPILGLSVILGLGYLSRKQSYTNC